MSVTGLLQVDVVGELHVLRVNTEDLGTACGDRDTNVDLAVEPTEPIKNRVDKVGLLESVGTLPREHKRERMGRTVRTQRG